MITCVQCSCKWFDCGCNGRYAQAMAPGYVDIDMPIDFWPNLPASSGVLLGVPAQHEDATETGTLFVEVPGCSCSDLAICEACQERDFNEIDGTPASQQIEIEEWIMTPVDDFDRVMNFCVGCERRQPFCECKEEDETPTLLLSDVLGKIELGKCSHCGCKVPSNNTCCNDCIPF